MHLFSNIFNFAAIFKNILIYFNTMKTDKEQTSSALSVEEFSRLAGVTAQTVRRWIKEGVINARKVSSRGLLKVWEIDEAELAKVKA